MGRHLARVGLPRRLSKPPPKRLISTYGHTRLQNRRRCSRLFGNTTKSLRKLQKHRSAVSFNANSSIGHLLNKPSTCRTQEGAPVFLDDQFVRDVVLHGVSAIQLRVDHANTEVAGRGKGEGEGRSREGRQGHRTGQETHKTARGQTAPMANRTRQVTES